MTGIHLSGDYTSRITEHTKLNKPWNTKGLMSFLNGSQLLVCPHTYFNIKLCSFSYIRILERCNKRPGDKNNVRVKTHIIQYSYFLRLSQRFQYSVYTSVDSELGIYWKNSFPFQCLFNRFLLGRILWPMNGT